MSKLCISRLPVGWEEVSKVGNEIVLALAGRDSPMYAKLRLVDYVGRAEEIEKEMQGKAACIEAIDSEHGSFLCNHIKWNADYYVCEGSDKFRAFFYAVLDGCYLIFEMVTNSVVMHTIFCSEAKRLMLAVDYGVIEHDNQFELNSTIFRLRTPTSFRFSALSEGNRLFFLGETKYLLVNINIGTDGLAGYVENLISLNYLGTMGSVIKIDRVGEDIARGVHWVRYKVEGDMGCIGTGTYFMQEEHGEQIISYLFERGESTINVSNLLEFGGGQG